MKTQMHTIGIIGCGNMGRSIAEGIKTKYRVYVFDKDKKKNQDLTRVNIVGDIKELLEKAGSIILAVKPQDFDAVLGQIKDKLKTQLVISIAAGIPTAYIEKQFGKIRLVRVMPNLAVKVNKGMICLCKGRYAFAKDLDFVQQLFKCLGKTMLVDEGLMNAVTAISGSGPGFLFDLIKGKKEKEGEDYSRDIFIPQLSLIAKKMGFTEQEAEVLVGVTVKGSMALLKETGLSAQDLCLQICSKGGTTEAGLAALHTTNSLEEAVKAAISRAEGLSK